MKKLSVIVNGISNNERFLNNLFTEIGNEITTEVKGNKIIFMNLDDEKSGKIYDALAKIVITEYSKKLLVRIINRNCDYFTKADKFHVWNLSVKHLLDDEREKNRDYVYRLEAVKRKISEFFDDSELVSVEGFVNFRLKELEYELEEIVEDCVQEYLLELEYIEFINTLRYFISVQQPKYLSVEIIYGQNILIYGDGKNITSECLKDFNQGLNSTETNSDDYILNSLISTAPKRVVIKQKEKLLGEEIKKTLLGIFGDKLKITTE